MTSIPDDPVLPGDPTTDDLITGDLTTDNPTPVDSSAGDSTPSDSVPSHPAQNDPVSSDPATVDPLRGEATSGDGSGSGGGGGSGGAVKEKVARLRQQVIDMDIRTEQLERQKEEVEDYIGEKYEERRDLTILYEETEERLRKTEERLKAMTEQVRDAEIFLEESTNFHRFLSQDTVGEDKIAQLQQRLDTCKELHEESSKQCRKAEKRKVKLTRQNETINNRLKASLKKIDSLQLKLEYARIDEGRKHASCEKQKQLADDCMQRFESLDIALQDAMQRKAVGYDKIVSLKERILSLDEELDEVQRNRVDVELRTRDLKLYGSMHTVY